jgi:hypothetical protein
MLPESFNATFKPFFGHLAYASSRLAFIWSIENVKKN